MLSFVAVHKLLREPAGLVFTVDRATTELDLRAGNERNLLGVFRHDKKEHSWRQGLFKPPEGLA